MTASDRPLIDDAALADLRSSVGDDEFVRELVEAYVLEGAGYVESMAAAIRDGDVAGVVRPAHTLKSSSASVGAARMAELCGAIETAARMDETGGLASDIDEARRTWESTLEAFRSAGLLA